MWSELSSGKRWACLILTAGFALGISSCSRDSHAQEEARVAVDFDSFRTAMVHRHAEQIVTYLPQNVSDYLALLNSSDYASSAHTLGSPGVNLLLRSVLDRKVDPAVRAHLNLQLLLQRLADRGLLDSRDIRGLSLGRVNVQGDRATAELYFKRNLLPLRLPLVRQASIWKVDLLAMVPYAEILMRLDRAVTGKTESQQVAQIVQPLPPL